MPWRRAAPRGARRPNPQIIFLCPKRRPGHAPTLLCQIKVKPKTYSTRPALPGVTFPDCGPLVCEEVGLGRCGDDSMHPRGGSRRPGVGPRRMQDGIEVQGQDAVRRSVQGSRWVLKAWHGRPWGACNDFIEYSRCVCVVLCTIVHLYEGVSFFSCLRHGTAACTQRTARYRCRLLLSHRLWQKARIAMDDIGRAATPRPTRDRRRSPTRPCPRRLCSRPRCLCRLA